MVPDTDGSQNESCNLLWSYSEGVTTTLRVVEANLPHTGRMVVVVGGTLVVAPGIAVVAPGVVVVAPGIVVVAPE
jgi:hypothetical protein